MVNKKNNYGIIKKGAMRAEQRKIFKEYEGMTVRLGYLDQDGDYQGQIGIVDIVKGSKYVHFTIDGTYNPIRLNYEQVKDIGKWDWNW